MKRTYEVRDRADKRAIREFLKREGAVSASDVVTARVASGPDLLEEPYSRKLRVLLETRVDQRLVRIQLRRHQTSRTVPDTLFVQLPVQSTGLYPVVHGTATDPQIPGDHRLVHPLLEVMTEQHALLPSDHCTSTFAVEAPSEWIGRKIARGGAYIPTLPPARSKHQVCNFRWPHGVNPRGWTVGVGWIDQLRVSGCISQPTPPLP